MGQKVNPRGFRVGVNELWANESQCYGKNFKNPRQLEKKFKQTSTFLNQYFERKELIKGQTQSKFLCNKLTCMVQYVPFSPQIDPSLKNASKKLSILCETNVKIKKFNSTFWYQNGLLVCAFVTAALKKGLPLRKIINIIQVLLDQNKKHQIVLKTCVGTKTFEFMGLKLRYAGRFGGSRSRMANSIVYRLGTVSLQKLETHIEFFEKALYTKQGLCNLQVWMSYKQI
uniref:Ribosomal protein S3 n=1 Tax=Wildemania schizophylla TaxID=1134705 RepID=A0A068F589_WILSC|nr:ribosomal protein S3 [Wildemania schizophylla]AID57264.1 ribosomal protein S3 [Wildemania schizophylla]